MLVCVISIKQNQHTHIHPERDRECYKNLAKTATNAAHVRFYYVKCLLGPTGPGRTRTSPSTTTVTCAVCSWFYFSCNSVFLYIVVVAAVVVNVQLSLRLSHFTFHIHSTSVTGRNWPQRILFYARAKKVCNTISQNSVPALFLFFLHLPLSAHSTPLQSRLTLRCPQSARIASFGKFTYTRTTSRRQRTNRFAESFAVEFG